MHRLLLLLIAFIGITAPARAAEPFVELRPALCHAVTASELPPSAYSCTGTPAGYRKAWLWLRAAAPSAFREIDGTAILLIDQPRFRSVVAQIRYDDGSLWSDRIDAAQVGDHWSVGGYLQFVVPKRDARPVEVTLGFERLAAWELVRKVRIYSTSEYGHMARNWTILIGLVAGAILASLIYNLFLFAGLRYRYLTHYVLWTTFTLAHALCWSNVIFFVLPELAGPWGVRVNLWTAAAAVFFSMTFFVSFIEPGKLPRAYARVLPLAGLLVVAVAALGAFEALVPALLFAQLFDAAIVVGTVAVLTGTLVAMQRGSRSARFYFVAWAPPIVAILLRVGRNAGFIPHMDIVDQGVFIASALQTVLLSLAMADRFVRYRSERDSANAEREQLRTLAETDQLTGLYNRRGFVTRAQAMLAPGDTSVGLILLDLDHFKDVNDAHGHDTGDIVLMRAGRALARCLRPSDIAGRLGGEEFGVVIPDADKAPLIALAERIRREIAGVELNDLLGSPAKVTVSVGVASSRQSGEGFPKLYRAADQALYTAKKEGRDRVCAHRPGPTAVTAAWSVPATGA